MRYLFDGGWKFLETGLDADYDDLLKRRDEFEDSFAKVEIPHDFLIHDSDNLYKDATGWYSKDFEYCPDPGMGSSPAASASDDEQSFENGDELSASSCHRCFITFEGVYMDCTIYVNDKRAFEWKYGYSSFSFDMTDYLRRGSNNISVFIRHQSPNTRWYSGAGIYRDVWLTITDSTYLAIDGVYLSTRPKGDDYVLRVETEVCGERAGEAGISASISAYAGRDSHDQVSDNLNSGKETTYDKNSCNSHSYDKNSDGSISDELNTDKLISDEVISFKQIPVTDYNGATKVTAPACDYKELESGQVRYRYIQEYLVKSPLTWDPSNPNLYNIKVTLTIDGREVDEYRTRLGFKHVVLDPDKGFIINGQNIKLNGVCEHHDLGALGSAFNKKAMKRKLLTLKSMGVNAIRGTHNMVAPGVLDLMDEMGFVFISEAFDMWRKPKTTYDYARFFDSWHERDVASWVRRDRNHVCVAFWSIGNEIYDTHADDDGQRITKELSDLVRKYDYNGNARPTIGSNYMPWENARKCADILKVAGYNYAEKYYEEHHKEHPDWIIYGSETSSIVQSRGIYHFPASASVLSDDDEQCSSLGNSQTSWGAKSIESCIRVDRDTPFSMGQFLWTGFDYIGEPTPYHTKNSYFGQIDTAGFPKDAYYEWKAAWTDHKKAPMIHICPSFWDFNEGQTIDLKIVTNAPKARLFINGEDKGSHDFSNKPGSGSKIEWNLQVPYTKGYVEARAYDEDGRVVATDVIKSFTDPVKLVLRNALDEYTNTKDCKRFGSKSTYSNCNDSVDMDTNNHSIYSNDILKSNTRDLAFIEISALDAGGVEVANAQNRVSVSVTGPGRLVGLDNGDSSDFDSYKATSRRLFGGKLLAIIQATDAEGEIVVTATSKGLESTSYTLKSFKDMYGKTNYIVRGEGDETSNDIKSLDHSDTNHNKVAESGDAAGNKAIDSDAACNEVYCYEPFEVIDTCHNDDIKLGSQDEIPIRKIELINESGSNVLTKGSNEVRVSAKIYPDNATYKDITFQVVTEFGVKSNIADLSAEGNTAIITAKGDGKFYLRALSCNGGGNPRIISYMDFEVQGMGAAFLDPYSFVAGSLYSEYEGEVGNGNDKGVATARGQRTLVTYDRLNFGRDTSDEITIPVFSLDGGANRIRILSGGEVVLDKIYDKPPIWNVYQEVTWKLDKPLTGVCDLSFETWDKLHLKGFEFTRYRRAFGDNNAVDADEIYGDTYTVKDGLVSGIGNNVSLVYKDMNFGDEKPSHVNISGRAVGEKNTIHILFDTDKGSTREILEVEATDDITDHTFDISNIEGDGTVTFVFLPGSNFDMKSFRFSK